LFSPYEFWKSLLASKEKAASLPNYGIITEAKYLGSNPARLFLKKFSNGLSIPVFVLPSFY
jgi:hypothetical protein